MNILAKPVESETSSDGTLTAGFLFASIKNIGNNPAIVNGVFLPPGEAKGYPFVGKGYEQISYRTNGSRLRILQII